MSKNLIELGLEYQSLEAAIAEHAAETGGEVTPEIDAMLEESMRLEYEVSGKLDKYGYVFERNKSEIEILKGRIKALQQRAKALESTETRMKDRLLAFMRMLGLGEIKGEYYRYRIADNGGKLPLILSEDLDPASLPPVFVEQRLEVNKDAIRGFLEAGNELEWARFGERGQNVRIA